ncbi:MAG: sigma-54-dependent Fis family transcriptional regulator [Thiomargarita sp.]|nr:sigma-54-dependent Fis family transcriptional regulator [Thiomargarita sp.]
MKPLCLIIDDEPDILELLEMTLNPMDIRCYTAATVAEAQKHLHANTFDLCLTDMRLPDGDGLDIIKMIGQHYSHTPVAVITAHGNMETAVQALKAGAFDCIAKPIKVPELRKLVTTALQLPKQSHTTPHQIKEDNQRETILSTLIGQSESMQTVRNTIEKLARSQAHIYIKGESGTGKEVVARMIHALGARARKPFIPVNCGAIPSELMESEFFGHVKGAFSGAINNKEGLFQAAQGGTLFLDEIADLPLQMQVKLLRAIQDKQVRSIGSIKEVAVDIRILCATHRDLAKLVDQGAFREDLFYRINVIELDIPPLRERIEDIPALVNKILLKFKSNKRINLSKSAFNALKTHNFPGNVRELENIIERAMTLCDQDIIVPEDLQLPEIQMIAQPKNSGLDAEIKFAEKETIANALKQTKGNTKKTAQLLNIGIGALRYRIQKYNIVLKRN